MGEVDMRLKMDVSIVIPMFNEAGNVFPLVTQILENMRSQVVTFEILLVDDGSQDSTWQQIEKASAEYEEVVGFKLSRNFGHQHALLAGFQHSQGAAVISMDADLQHPPSVLPQLIKRWRSGNKIVYTKRHSSKDTSAFKRFTSDVFYRFFSWMTNVPVGQGASDFRLIDRQVLNELIRFNDVSPFVRGAVRWLGYEDVSSTIEFDADVRLSGESQYSLNKMLAFANAAIVSFSTKPLIVAIWIGVLTSVMAFAELCYILFQYSIGETVPGWASTVGIMSLLFGILFILLGIIGLYLAQIHSALQMRPKFVIERSTVPDDEEKS